MKSIFNSCALCVMLLLPPFTTVTRQTAYGQSASLPEKSGGVGLNGAGLPAARLDIRLLCGWNGIDKMENAFVSLSGPVSLNLIDKDFTHFDLSALPAGIYSVSGIKDAEPLNGVSTMDLVRLAKHLMNIEPFEQPWQWIAADADQSNTVTYQDLHLLQQWMLGRYAELPENESYRFVNPSHAFPFPFPLEEPVPDAHTFYWDPARPAPVSVTLAGIKIGDVDASSRCAAMNPKNAAQTLISLPDIHLQAGETARLPVFISGENSGLLGLQLALCYDPGKIKIEGVTAANLPNFGPESYARVRPGLLTLSWFDVFPLPVSATEPVFEIRVQAQTEVDLREVLRLDNEQLAGEAYDADGLSSGLQMQFLKDFKAGTEFFIKNTVNLNEASITKEPLLQRKREK